jgi:FKBP-type peptidyl-prolyl cis-trans isomerase FkpA
MNFKYFLLCCLLVLALGSCKSESGISPQEQLAADEVRIKEFIAKNNIPAIRHESGLYYQIIEPGSGSLAYTENTTVTANYALRYLNGQLIEKSNQPFTNSLGGPRGLIEAWKIGIPLIQKGGKIRLISPSGLAYGPTGYASIPPNAILDFDIELVDATN